MAGAGDVTVSPRAETIALHGNETIFGVKYDFGLPLALLFRNDSGHKSGGGDHHGGGFRRALMSGGGGGGGSGINTGLLELPSILDPEAVVSMSAKLLAGSEGNNGVYGALLLPDTSCGHLYCGSPLFAPIKGGGGGEGGPYAYTVLQNTSSTHACPIYANLAHGAIKRHVDAARAAKQLATTGKRPHAAAAVASKITVRSKPLPQTKAYHAAVTSSQAFPITFFTQVWRP